MAKISRKPAPRAKAGRPGRSPDDVQRIMLRMGKGYVRQMDQLCKVNERSRRELIEFLVAEAFEDWQLNPASRIVPV